VSRRRNYRKLIAISAKQYLKNLRLRGCNGILSLLLENNSRCNTSESAKIASAIDGGGFFEEIDMLLTNSSRYGIICLYFEIKYKVYF